MPRPRPGVTETQAITWSFIDGIDVMVIAPHSRSRYEHQRTSNGLDLRPVREIPRLLPWRGYGQTNRNWRLAGASRRRAEAASTQRWSTSLPVGITAGRTLLVKASAMWDRGRETLRRARARVLKVSDITGGYFNDEGIDIESAITHCVRMAPSRVSQGQMPLAARVAHQGAIFFAPQQSQGDYWCRQRGEGFDCRRRRNGPQP